MEFDQLKSIFKLVWNTCFIWFKFIKSIWINCIYSVNPGYDAPDMNNGYHFRDYAGLWMFYMDFKSNYRTWQAMCTVNPKTCRMTVEIVKK